MKNEKMKKIFCTGPTRAANEPTSSLQGHPSLVSLVRGGVVAASPPTPYYVTICAKTTVHCSPGSSMRHWIQEIHPQIL